ncbi:hypothetical protein PVAP13_5NG093081 [Panicum virgatum]|uniref:Uncharacterized protein n=1 Tax=Panicum virgatum TaxID=38727 RepID=A0A8T0RQ08_PANVG|nr:hypothetical protein PVAP13_5NG093081 [Panicum virgatum]
MATTLSLKLLIDRKAQRVLFAEVSKITDFLLSLLALPVATAVKLLGKDAMVGCAGNLYASVEKLDSTYIQTGAQCTGTSYSNCRTYVTCVYGRACPTCGNTMAPFGGLHRGFTSGSRKAAPSEEPEPELFLEEPKPYQTGPMSAAAQLLSSSAVSESAVKGFEQGMMRYMVLDNLTVTPISTVSTFQHHYVDSHSSSL